MGRKEPGICGYVVQVALLGALLFFEEAHSLTALSARARPQLCQMLTAESCMQAGYLREPCDPTCRTYYFCDDEDREWDFYKLICDYQYAFSLEENTCVPAANLVCPVYMPPPPPTLPPPPPTTPAPEPPPTEDPRCYNGQPRHEWPCDSEKDQLGETQFYYYQCRFDSSRQGYRRIRVDCPFLQCTSSNIKCHVPSLFDKCFYLTKFKVPLNCS